MSFLARFRIISKFLAVILLMSAIAGSVAFFGISSMKTMNEHSVKMLAATERSLVAARLSQNVIALNRAEFRAALDPRNDNREASRKVVEEQYKSYEDRFARLSLTNDERARAILPEIAEAFKAYRKSIDTTFQLAESFKNTSLSESSAQLREHSMEGRALSENLEVKMRAASDFINAHAELLSKESTEIYDSASMMMLITRLRVS
jgi:methyl-accepting chemotaxis protein